MRQEGNKKMLSQIQTCWLWTELGALAMVAAVASETVRELFSCFERAMYAHFLVGVSKGAALVFVVAEVVTQTAACICVMTPVLYHKIGPGPPSAAIAVCTWIQTFVFGSPREYVFMARCAAISTSAAMLALFRFDRAARYQSQQLPEDPRLLRAEEEVRRVCTRAKVGVWCPVVAVVLLFFAVHSNPWAARGAVLEFLQVRFQTILAVSSLLFQIAGQDTQTRIWVSADFKIALEEASEKAVEMWGFVVFRARRAAKRAMCKKTF